MAQAHWYRLDNIGKFYSAQAGRSFQTVFRLSATMDGPIDPSWLQVALDEALIHFPGFNVTLRSGLFWHYLEEAKTTPLVEEEFLPICFGLHRGPRSHLFRVTYYRDRINLEMSHIISDGRGTVEFFKALLTLYSNGRYDESASVTSSPTTTAEQTEDSFSKNYEREKASRGPSTKAYKMKGWKDVADPTFIEYHTSTPKMLEASRKMGVSATSLMIAIAMEAIRWHVPQKDKDREINVTVPVDLRSIYGSSTLRNFFGLAFIKAPAKPSHMLISGDPSDLHSRLFKNIEHTAKNVQKQLKKATEPEAIKRRMNMMVKLEKNPILRISPLFLKDLVLSFASKIADKDATTSVSNLGPIELDEETSKHVKNINVLTTSTNMDIVMSSFKESLTIGITSTFTDLVVVKDICRILTKLGIGGYIDINKGSAEIDRQLKLAQAERALLKPGGEDGL